MVVQRNTLIKLPTKLFGVFAHPDDELLGPGGLLMKNVRLGGSSHIICMGGSDLKRTRELKKACKVAGITCEIMKKQEGKYHVGESKTVQTIKKKIMLHKPEIVVTHRPQWDYHPDHRTTSRIAKQAAVMAGTPKKAHFVKGLFYSEGHSLHPVVHCFVDISKEFNKLVAAAKCHKSQMVKNDNYYLKTLEARARLRGVQAGCLYAEAFQFEPLQLVGSMNRRNLGI